MAVLKLIFTNFGNPIVIFSIFFISFLYHIPSAADPKLKESSTVLIDELLKSETQIGKLNLADVRSQMNDIQWISQEDYQPPAHAEGRASANCLYGQKVVSSPMKLSELYDSSMDVLALHESLCALGYRDKDYDLSIGLSILSKSKDTPNFNLMLEQMPAGIFGSSLEYGGTSVGGGGDLVALTIKYDLMNTFLRHPDLISDLSSLTFLSHFVIEPEYNPSKQQVRVEIREDGTSSIYVPALLLSEKPREKGKILDEVESIVLSLIRLLNTQTFDEHKCNGSSIQMPEVLNPKAAPVQKIMIRRFYKGFGCKEQNNLSSQDNWVWHGPNLLYLSEIPNYLQMIFVLMKNSEFKTKIPENSNGSRIEYQTDLLPLFDGRSDSVDLKLNVAYQLLDQEAPNNTCLIQFRATVKNKSEGGPVALLVFHPIMVVSDCE